MVQTRSLSFFLIAATMLAITCCGAEVTSAPPAAKASETQYTLGPGDQISLHVMDLDDVSDKAVRIDPAGNVDLPLVGKVGASGLTVEEFREALSKKLTKYIESPQISINVLEYHSQPVSILGAVTNPGIQQLQGPKRLLDVISTAGGLKPEAGAELTITRPKKMGNLPVAGSHLDSTGEFYVGEVAIDQLTTAQDPKVNINVRPHDTITIPKADIVYVLGQVKRAGGFPITTHDSLSLLKALALAEGLDRDASPKKARIMRASTAGPSGRTDTPVNLQDILDGKAPDLQLHADDVLFIPDNVARSATRRFAEAAIQVATGVAIYRR